MSDLSAYVQQNDVFIGSLTVIGKFMFIYKKSQIKLNIKLEHLRFNANLRMSHHSKNHREERINQGRFIYRPSEKFSDTT